MPRKEGVFIMTEDEIHKLHQLTLKIANEIKRICENNGIQYSLSGGTLLGAVRHRGFIPWDDDMDIDMTRENYDRFINKCKTELGSEYILQTWITDTEYHNGFAKILLKGTCAIEKRGKDTICEKGIFVDIFPWDNIPHSQWKRNIHNIHIQIFKNLLIAKHGAKIPENSKMFKKGIFIILQFISRFMTHRYLVAHCERELRKYPPGDMITCAVGVLGYKSNTIPSSWHNHYLNLPFEDTTFSAIEKYDDLLKQSYGDYMTPPSLSKRKCHEYVKLDFGNY